MNVIIELLCQAGQAFERVLEAALVLTGKSKEGDVGDRLNQLPRIGLRNNL